jgi:hypothetical protein
MVTDPLAPAAFTLSEGPVEVTALVVEGLM